MAYSLTYRMLSGCSRHHAQTAPLALTAYAALLSAGASEIVIRDKEIRDKDKQIVTLVDVRLVAEGKRRG